MNLSNDFNVLFSEGDTNTFTVSSSDTLPIVKWESVTPSPVGTVADTISAGVKWAWVIIPDTITTNNFYSLSIKSTAPSLWSDTITNDCKCGCRGFTIDSIIGGFNNSHTPSNDWGMCEGDTVVLYASKGLAGYQWTLSGSPISGATSDSLIVFTSGDYGVIGSSGNCTIALPRIRQSTVLHQQLLCLISRQECSRSQFWIRILKLIHYNSVKLKQ